MVEFDEMVVTLFGLNEYFFVAVFATKIRNKNKKFEKKVDKK